MNTTSNAIAAAAPAKTPRVKKLRLLVDNLVHIHDHGVAVEFTDPQLAALVQTLTVDGEYKLESGHSWLKVITRGRVTYTHLFLAHGSYHKKAFHYYDNTPGLPAPLKFRQEDVAGTSYAFEMLEAVIFTGKAPRIIETHTAGEVDNAADFLTNQIKDGGIGWCFFGEAGMRAKAVDNATKNAAGRIDSAEVTLRDARNSLEHKTNQNVDDLIKGNLKTWHDSLRRGKKVLADKLRLLRAPLEPGFAGFSSADRTLFTQLFGYQQRIYDFEFMSLPEGSCYWPSLPGHEAASTPMIMRPNYKAVIGEDDTITVDSGIKVPFKASEVMAWLRGESTTPLRTPYGDLQKLEASTPEGQPVCYLKAGCHVIDASLCGGEWAELMKPAHEVVHVPARGWVKLPGAPVEKGAPVDAKVIECDREGRIKLFEEARDQAVASHEAEDRLMRERAAVQARNTDAEFKKMKENKPNYLAGLRDTVTQAEALVATRKQELAALHMAYGKTPGLVEYNTLARTMVTMLQVKMFNPKVKA